MTRISELPLDQWDPDLRAQTRADAMPPMVRQRMAVTAHAPHMVRAIAAFKAEVAKGRLLSPRLVELVRLRTAFHNQCRTCMAVRYQSAFDDGLTDDMDAPAVVSVMLAGVLYLMLRAKTESHFLGVPLRTQEGWDRINGALEHLVKHGFPDTLNQESLANLEARRKKPRPPADTET